MRAKRKAARASMWVMGSCMVGEEERRDLNKGSKAKHVYEGG